MTTNAQDIQSAKRTIDKEIEALRMMEDQLDDSLCKALDVMQKTTGRVIITGMGKSGHIGSKIAATLASTGTPSFFVHPGEASHGDLGMLTASDSVVAISNSGETKELSDIIIYCKRYGIPLIAITKNPDSALGRAGDVLLKLRKGFSKTDFRQRHPGGKLGAFLQKVSDLMHTGDDMPLVGEEASMQDALLTMTSKMLGCVGIINKQGELLGIITDGDLRRCMSPQVLTEKAADVMTRNPKTIAPDVLAAEALNTMNNTGKGITQLFVVNNGKPVGIIHIHDCLRAGVA